MHSSSKMPCCKATQSHVFPCSLKHSVRPCPPDLRASVFVLLHCCPETSLTLNKMIIQLERQLTHSKLVEMDRKTGRSVMHSYRQVQTPCLLTRVDKGMAALEILPSKCFSFSSPGQERSAWGPPICAFNTEEFIKPRQKLFRSLSILHEELLDNCMCLIVMHLSELVLFLPGTLPGHRNCASLHSFPLLFRASLSLGLLYLPSVHLFLFSSFP